MFTDTIEWRASPRGKCQVAEVPGFTLLAGEARDGAWWRVCAVRYRFGVAETGRIITQGRAPKLGYAELAAEQSVPTPITDPAVRQQLALDPAAWRPSSTGNSLTRVSNGYGLSVGHTFWQVRELDWHWGNACPTDRIVHQGKAADLETAMVAAWAWANPTTLPEPHAVPAPVAPIAPQPAPAPPAPRDRAAMRKAKQAAQADRAEGYLEHLENRLAHARRVPPIAPTSAALRAELEANLAVTRAAAEAERARLAAAEGRPDTWPTKAERVAKARTQLRIALAKRELAELSLGAAPTAKAA